MPSPRRSLCGSFACSISRSDQLRPWPTLFICSQSPPSPQSWSFCFWAPNLISYHSLDSTSKMERIGTSLGSGTWKSVVFSLQEWSFYAWVPSSKSVRLFLPRRPRNWCSIVNAPANLTPRPCGNTSHQNLACNGSSKTIYSSLAMCCWWLSCLHQAFRWCSFSQPFT